MVCLPPRGRGLCATPFSFSCGCMQQSLKHASGSIDSCCRSGWGWALQVRRTTEPLYNSSVIRLYHSPLPLTVALFVPSSSCTWPTILLLSGSLCHLNSCGYCHSSACRRGYHGGLAGKRLLFSPINRFWRFLISGKSWRLGVRCHLRRPEVLYLTQELRY